jgi:hypothetical protein
MKLTLERNKMKLRLLFFLDLLLIAATGGPVDADTAYWTSVRTRPVFIVVGTLSEVTKSAFVFPGWKERDGSETLAVYDRGWIDVERVLYGDSIATRLPISWFSDTWVDPPRADGLDIVSSSEETHSVGERGIWVLWSRNQYTGEFSKCFAFQALPVEILNRVETEIKAMGNK